MNQSVADLARLYAPWQEAVHADFFDAMADWSDSAIRRRYETFNDVGLLTANLPYRNSRLLEVGCATGDLYRYLARFHPEIDYTGVDISAPAIERARQKYPRAQFELVGDDLAGAARACRDPGIVYCKDVLLHQTDPFGFLDRLLRLPSDTAVIRLRTRDRGATVLDPALSCQRHYNGWVPYMVLNTDELIDAVRKGRASAEIAVLRHYMVLGGQHGRFLPKECYEPETGTAETTLVVRFPAAHDEPTEPAIRILDRPEPAADYTPWQRLRRQVRIHVPFGRALFSN